LAGRSADPLLSVAAPRCRRRRGVGLDVSGADIGTKATLAIGLDVGGTKIAAGVVSARGELLDRIAQPTPPPGSAETTLSLMLRLVQQLRQRYPEVQAVGAGAAGLVDWPGGHVRWAPNNSYRDLPLRAILSAETGLPAVADNDANAAAWAEACLGAGAGRRDLLMLTVGTGIGAGLILGGRLYRGATGIGGEAGHIIVDPGGPRCGCGSTGCLEAMGSGGALSRAGRAAAWRDPDGPLARLAGGPGQVTGETVFQAARDGDATALALFAEAGYWLGVGIASLASLLDSELVVIGGGLSAAGELLLGPARSAFERFVFARDHRTLPPIVPARLGPEAGIVGAALLALDAAPGPNPGAAGPAAAGLATRGIG
jgi:glucokinase